MAAVQRVSGVSFGLRGTALIFLRVFLVVAVVAVGGGWERARREEAEEGQRSRAAMGQLESNESQRRVSLGPCKVPRINDAEGLRGLRIRAREGEASTGLILVVQGSLVTVNQWGGGGLQPMSRRLASLTSSKTPRPPWHLCGHFPRFLTSGWWNGRRACPIEPLSLCL